LFCGTITSAQLYKLLCKQCVFVAAYTICNKYDVNVRIYEYYIVDILNILTWWTYLLLMLLGVLCWRVLSWGVYWAVWHVVSLMLTREYSGLGSLGFCSSVSPVVVELACKRTPSSSYSFPYCMFLITACFALDFHILVYCWCVMCMSR
jgi:hypothetical protein